MSKKTILLVVSLVLALSLSLGGTLAYLTDRDADTNIFTVGNVDIDLNEDFVQGSELIPGEKIEKRPMITNEGNNEVWVWMTVAIPAGMENGEKNLLGWDTLDATDSGKMEGVTQDTIDTYIEEGWLPEGTTAEQIQGGDNWVLSAEKIGTDKIDEVDYNVYLFKYATPLNPGETTLASFYQVYMDSHVDISPEGDLAWVENGVATELGYNISTMGNPKIYVAAYGIQADGFETVDDAYEAYGVQWGENGGVTYTQETIANPESGAVRPAGYVPAADEGEINNLIVIDDSDETTNLRAIYNDSAYSTEDLTINNSYLDGTYAMNLYAVEANDVNLFVNNTTCAGWSSYTGYDMVTFTNCTFKANSNPEIYNVIRPYDETLFVGCEFDGTDFKLDKLAGSKITLDGCTYQGVAITDASQLTISLGDASSVVIK